MVRTSQVLMHHTQQICVALSVFHTRVADRQPEEKCPVPLTEAYWDVVHQVMLPNSRAYWLKQWLKMFLITANLVV